MERDRLPKGWEIKRLGDILTLIQNGTTARQNTNHIGYPVSRIETIQQSKFDDNRVRFVELTLEDFNKYKYEIGDIAFSHINSFELVGKVAIYNGHPDKLIHGMNLLRLRVNKQLCNPAFLYHFLQSEDARLQLEPKIKRAINQASVNQQNVKSLEVPLPPLSEQHHIVARIEELTRRIEEAKGLRLAAQKETESIMPSALHEVLSHREKEGWEIEWLDNLLVFKDSGVWGPEDHQSGYAVLRSTNFNNNGSLCFDNIAKRRVESIKVGSKKLVKGDILLERSGGGPKQPVGRVAYFDKDGDTFVFGNFITRLRVKDGTYPKFLLFMLLGLYYQGATNKLQKQTTGIRNLNFKEYLQFEIPLPPLSEQYHIVAYLDQLQSSVDELRRLQQETQKEINSVTSAVLDKAFRGEL